MAQHMFPDRASCGIKRSGIHFLIDVWLHSILHGLKGIQATFSSQQWFQVSFFHQSFASKQPSTITFPVILIQTDITIYGEPYMGFSGFYRTQCFSTQNLLIEKLKDDSLFVPCLLLLLPVFLFRGTFFLGLVNFRFVTSVEMNSYFKII